MIVYKSNREKNNKSDKSFWGSKDIFYNDVCFDKNKAQEYFGVLTLDETEKCLFIEEFINLYTQHKINHKNQYWFNKSLKFIQEVSGITSDMVYKFTIEHFGKFEKKEDFEIFYYFKSFNILQNGYNNIFLELLNWFSHNEKVIKVLLENNNNKKEEKQLSSFFLIGTTGFGKSLYVKQQLLKDGLVVISQKDMSLKTFMEEDKVYFYELLINLTTGKNIHNLLNKIEENRSNIEFKGVARYIDKRVKFEMLYQKMLLKEESNNQQKHKILKI